MQVWERRIEPKFTHKCNKAIVLASPGADDMQYGFVAKVAGKRGCVQYSEDSVQACRTESPINTCQAANSLLAVSATNFPWNRAPSNSSALG